MLDKIELQLKIKGIRNINVEAQKSFPQRSLNAIRSHRRQPTSRSILQKYQARMEPGGSDGQSGGTSNRAMEMTLAPSREDFWADKASAKWKLNSLEKKRINLALHTYLPNVPAETIRKVRNKPGYRKFLNSFIIQKKTCPVKPTKYSVNITLTTSSVEKFVNSEIQLKQFLLANYKYIKLPGDELSELLNWVTDIDSKRRLIDKEYIHWMENLETHREITGADSCVIRPPNVIPTSGKFRSDKNKTGNQFRQFRTRFDHPWRSWLSRIFIHVCR